MLRSFEVAKAKKLTFDEVEKHLFAEDFVTFIMGMKALPRPQVNAAQPYRPFVTNVFRPVIRVAIAQVMEAIDAEISEEFEGMKRNNLVTTEVFESYALQNSYECLKRGFQPEFLLKVFMRLAFMSTRFYKSGVHKAPDFAVIVIASVLRENFCVCGWERLYLAAKRISEL